MCVLRVGLIVWKSAERAQLTNDTLLQHLQNFGDFASTKKKSIITEKNSYFLIPPTRYMFIIIIF